MTVRYTTVVGYAVQHDSSDNLPFYPPDHRHCADAV